MSSCEEKKINAYMMSILDLGTLINHSTTAAQKVSNIVPLAKSSKNKISYTTKNNVKCLDVDYHGYDNIYGSNLTISDHINQKDNTENDYVVLSSDDYKIIEQIVLTHLDCCFNFRYFECIYDKERSNEKIYTYSTKMFGLVKLLELKGFPQIDKLLSMNPNKVYATNEKKDEPYLANNTYEVLFATTMTLGEHVRMYQRDQNICNYNTVNHNIEYYVVLSQEQYDLLSSSMLSDDPSFQIYVEKNLESRNTQSLIFASDAMLFLSNDHVDANARLKQMKMSKEENCVIF
jgi:hypothetical protein